MKKDIFDWTRGDLQSYLKEKCCGKQWRSYGGTKWDIYNAFRNLFEKDYPELYQQLSFQDYEKSQTDFQIRFGKSYFLWITLKRKMTKRGNGSSSWIYRTSSEYEVVDITVSEFNKNVQTLREAIQIAIDSTKEQDRAALARKIKGIEILKDIMSKYGVDIYEARTLCSYVDKNYYSLDDYVKGTKPMPTLS